MPTNSIASPRRTDRPWLARALASSVVPTVLAAVILTVIVISFRPFQPGGATLEPDAGGDIVNQLGFSALGGLALFAMLSCVNPRTISAFFSPWWLLMLGFFGLSIMNATDPSAAARGGLFTLIGIIAVVAVLALPRDGQAFASVFAVAGITVVVISYMGLILLPGAAMHSGADVEWEHAGLWRGVFAHKNIAGPVMAGFSFAGLYLYRRGWKRRGLFLLITAIIFMANTGSKTTAGLVPLAILIVMVPGLIGMRRLTVLLVALAFVGTAVATLGIVFIQPVKELVLSQIPDLTYTGRTSLWEFAGEMIMKRPWTGYGFESFWRGVAVMSTDHPFDRAWDVRTMVHGHNGYVDIAVAMGLPALLVAIMAFFIEPMRDYIRIPPLRENILLGDFFMMVFLFTALNAFLESFFFRRVDPVWVFFLISVFGLRMVARLPVPSGSLR
ncbi:O-antigen ligase family protein [Arvimicrobium flavum]|uniref:O-antigen ligase family protein n=1 Tax=Arvimicrobium flavum TaxID=3393320 RepID=UPI00237B8094|nr:O-antigen ligase [Mesorhizobium shangrilense]